MVEEARNPHNVVLTFLSEWGLPGGIGLIWAMLAVSWRLTRPDGVDLGPNVSGRGPPSILSTGLILLLALLLIRVWAEWAYPASFLVYEDGVLGLIWLAAFVLACLDRNELGPINNGPLSGLAGPLLAGAVAFLLHSLLDLAWFTPGALATLLAMVAVVLAPRAATCGQPSPRLGRSWLRGSVAGAVGVALVALLWGALIPAARSFHHLKAARAMWVAKAPARVVLAAYHQAVQADPLDPVAPAEAAAWLAEVDVQQALYGMPHPGPAIELVTEGIRRNPRDVGQQVLLSRLQDRACDLPMAIAAMQRAVGLYPTYPDHRLELGELLFRRWQQSGQVEWLRLAAEQFRQGLALDDARGGEQQRRLTEGQRAIARERLAKADRVLAAGGADQVP
jgi:hypothetical protein